MDAKKWNCRRITIDTIKDLENFCSWYVDKLSSVLASSDWASVGQLGKDMQECWLAGRQVFFCGNGGSAGNAIHLANDLFGQ